MGHVWDDWKIVRPSCGHRGEEWSLVLKVPAHVGPWELTQVSQGGGGISWSLQEFKPAWAVLCACVFLGLLAFNPIVNPGLL